jgi:folylpolyglutamate synthase/dihydropteroate synthase
MEIEIDDMATRLLALEHGAGRDPRRRPDTADLVVVAGSILLVGEVRARLLGLPHDPPIAL